MSPEKESEQIYESHVHFTKVDSSVYNATIQQRMDFDAFGDDAVITGIFDPVSDEVYLSNYDKKANLKITDNGQSAVTENAEGMVALFDAVVSDVLGIPGDKPENWKQQLDADQFKAPMMARFLGVACYQESFGWGQMEKAVISEAYFNNETVQCKHFLRPKTTEDIRKFRSFQKIPLVSKTKGLGSGDFTMSSYAEKKAKLYDQMKQRTEGYAENAVPIWHKVAVVDFIFSAGVSGKK